MQHVGIVAVLKQDGARLSFEYIIICVQLLVAERLYLPAAFMFLLRRHLAGNAQSLCAWALAVAEHMELAYGQCLHEAMCPGKQFVRLATHPDDDIHADEGIWDISVYLIYLLAEKFRIVAAVHEAKHFVAPALQRDVEVRHEGSALRTEADDFLCEQVRLYAADAIALDAFHLIESTEQVDEPFARCLAEVADVDARQHDFLASLPGSFFCLTDERCDAAVPASPSGEGYGAVGTKVVAAVLHLQEETCTLSASTSRNKQTHPRPLP